MSSFVINKKSYVRACGILAGLAELKESRFNEPVLRLWNYKLNRPYNAEDFKQSAAWLYHLNAVSVQKQYHDDQAAHDPESYNADFAEYMAKAKKAYHDPDAAKLERIVNELHHFFRSVLYQVEDAECERALKGFCYRLFFELQGVTAKKSGFDPESWGDFEIAY